MGINNQPIRFVMTGVALLVLAAACAPSAKAPKNIPDGFAAYADRDTVRAVSPDGVMYRIRMEKNEPFAKLPFWKEALKKRMLDAGYIFIKEENIEAGNRPGYLLELAAPLGARDFTYLIAVFTNDKKQIVIVESAGEMTLFKQRRETIISAIQKIRI